MGEKTVSENQYNKIQFIYILRQEKKLSNIKLFLFVWAFSLPNIHHASPLHINQIPSKMGVPANASNVTS